jgi:hypothetical protein
MSPSLKHDLKQDISRGGCKHGRLKHPRRQKSGSLRVCKRKRGRKRRSPRKSKSRRRSKRKRRTKMSMLRFRNAHHGAKCSPGHKKLKHPVKRKSGGYRHCRKSRRRKSKRKSKRRRKSRSRRRRKSGVRSSPRRRRRKSRSRRRKSA